MPLHLLHQCIEKMQRSVPLTKIAKWVLEHEERGGLNTVQSFASMRQYLTALALELAERGYREPSIEEAHGRLTADLVNQNRDIIPVVIPHPGKKGKYIPISQYLDERCAERDEELYLRAFLHMIYEALQRNREVEERYGDQNLPTQPFAPAMAQLVSQGVNVAEALRKRLDSAAERQKITYGIVEHAHELFSSRAVDMQALHRAIRQAADVILHDTVMALPGAKEAVAQLPKIQSETAPGPYDDLPAIERLFVRSYIEKDLALLKLQLEAEGQTGEHAAQPDPASVP